MIRGSGVEPPLSVNERLSRRWRWTLLKPLYGARRSTKGTWRCGISRKADKYQSVIASLSFGCHVLNIAWINHHLHGPRNDKQTVIRQLLDGAHTI